MQHTLLKEGKKEEENCLAYFAKAKVVQMYVVTMYLKF